MLVKYLQCCLPPPYYLLSVLTGINIPRKSVIGKGLRIHHYGCIVINNNSVIGDNCTLRHEVTIGNRRSSDDCPIIGDYCDIGAGAKILGKIVIGDNVTIGANAVVITDIPDNSLAVGIPARIIKKDEHNKSLNFKSKR